ncbi:MAG TPA: pilin [Candidatus Saccharimonadales bacterium]|jgi:TRAP-type C4-dicarboxylate transport system permease small subunit|nr:pilin [Candidatus Saccharimonadales bacterium]
MNRLIFYLATAVTTTQLYNPFPKVPADSTTISNILNLIFTIVGAVAFLFVILGGFKYVVSGGDPQSTAKAKNTIIYAAVGLIITLVASLIVNFVFGNL